MQPCQFIEFFLCAAGIALGAQGHCEVVMCLLEIGFQFDRATEGGDGSSSVAPSLQLAAQIELRIGIVGTQLHSGSELIERVLVVCLTPQGHAQHDVSRSKPRIEAYRVAKLCNSLAQFAELPLDNSEFQVSVR